MKDKLDYMHLCATQLDLAVHDLEKAADAMDIQLDLHQAESELEHASFTLMEEIVDTQAATSKCVAAMAVALHYHLSTHHGIPTHP